MTEQDPNKKSETDDKKDEKSKTVSIEEFQAQKEELDKLKKIFEERQTKQLKKEDLLKKDDILKALGIEKDPDKDPMDLINEKLSSTNTALEEVRKQLDTEKAEKEALKKETKARKAAEKFNFHNVDDVLKFADMNAEDLDTEFKNIAESKPYLVKKAENLGSSFNNGRTGESATEWAKAQEAAKNFY